jgi:hypothetical protein
MIGIIAAGRLVREGTIADLLHDADLVRVRVGPEEVARAAERLESLARADGVEVTDGPAGWIAVRIPASRAAEVNRTLAEVGIYAARLEAGSDLEDLFLALTADEGTSHEGTFRGISSARDEPEPGG